MVTAPAMEQIIAVRLFKVLFSSFFLLSVSEIPKPLFVTSVHLQCRWFSYHFYPDLAKWRGYMWIRTPVLRIRDVYPGSWFLPIPDLGSRIQNSNKRGVKKICYTFFWSLKFHKIVNYFTFEMLKKIFSRLIGLFTPKIVTKLSKIWI